MLGLEPMLVGFAVGVILVYILSSRLENKFAVYFRKIFPKVLVPIVVFQIVSSVLRTQDTGITHGRYYVILFGVFAAATGVLLSFMPVRKNGIIAALLIGFAAISIIPPVDAFTVSRANQVGILTTVLTENNMLEDDTITPNAAVSEEDKTTISNTASYLSMMGYTKDIPYLGANFDLYNDFYDIFGFYRYQESPYYGQGSVYLSLDQQSPLNISGYDTFVVVNFYYQDTKSESLVCNFEKDGKTYTLTQEKTPSPGTLRLTDEAGEELITINMQDVFDHFDTTAAGNYTTSKDAMSAEEATYTQGNDKADMSLVALFLNIEKSSAETMYNGDFYVLIKIK